MIEGPDAIVAVDDQVTRDRVRDRDGARAAVVASRRVRRAIPTVKRAATNRNVFRAWRRRLAQDTDDREAAVQLVSSH